MRLWHLRALLRPDRAGGELDEEVRFHLDQLAAQLVEQGWDPEEARWEARRLFGGVEQVKEQCRDAWGPGWVWSVLADLRYGWRALLHSPGFTAVAVLALAMGIGANVAVFSLAQAALLRPLPVREPSRLVELIAASGGARMTNLPAASFEYLRRDSQSFESLAASTSREAVLRVRGGTPSEARALFVSGEYFRTLGVGAARGRLIQGSDDQPGAPRIVVLSDALWRTRFGGRNDVLGESVWVDGVAATVVGVARRGAVSMDRHWTPELVMPLASERLTSALWLFGRLRPGVTARQAAARLQPLYHQALESMAATMDRSPADQRRELLSQRLLLSPAGNGGAGLRWQIEQPLRILGGVMLAILLVACTNVAALLLSRGERRSREIALRLALGASRARVVRQLLLESVELALLGSAASVGVAIVFHEALVSCSTLAPSAAVDFRLDWMLLGFTALVGSVAGILIGILPAMLLTRVDPHPVLKGERGTTSRRPARALRGVLAAQVATTFVLLATTGWFLHSLSALMGRNMGFDRDNLLVAQVASVDDGDIPMPDMGRQLVAGFEAQPGAASVAVAARSVFSSRDPWILTTWVDGFAYPPDAGHWTMFNAVGPGFFKTVGIRVLAGREFTQADVDRAPKVVVVNEAFARQYFGNASAVGRRLGHRGPASSRDLEIVGVVNDFRAEGVRGNPWPAMFLPIEQTEGGFSRLMVHVRTAPGSSQSFDSAARVVNAAGPRLYLKKLTTLDAEVSDSVRRDRMFARLTAICGALALFLTAIGFYGTIAHALAARTRELGVRLALGQSRLSLVWSMVRESSLVVGLGVAVGIPVALASERALHSVLFAASRLDLGVLAGAVALVAGIAGVSVALPAHRAASIKPMHALRHE